MRAEQLTDPVAFHGEGPFWDANRQRLLLVDMLAGDVVEVATRASGSGNTGTASNTGTGSNTGARSGTGTGSATATRHHVGTVAAALRARASGGFVLALERGFAFADDDLDVQQVLPEVFGDSAIRMNDGGCDPQGRFYCGTMAYAETPGAGSLYRLDSDLRPTTVLADVTISNGLQWSADGSRVYYNDTPTGRVDVFDFDGDTGSFTDRRPFVTLPAGLNPDGMAIDSQDGLWVAFWGGSAVHHFDATGALVDVIELPVTNVTACAFGGPDLETLYITTSRLSLPDDAQPDAGAVFVAEPGVRGAVPFAFAG